MADRAGERDAALRFRPGVGGAAEQGPRHEDWERCTVAPRPTEGWLEAADCTVAEGDFFCRPGVSSMNGMVNIISLEPGTKISLADGATAEVVSNPRDGIWVFVRYLAALNDPAQEGREEMVFAQDAVAVLETP